MIGHALHIVANELSNHLRRGYSNPAPGNVAKAEVGNIAGGIEGTGGVPADKIILTLVNYKEEKALKNLPNYIRNDVTLKASYQNPPVYLNFNILFTATHKSYSSALIDLSRVFRFFQSNNVFTQDNVAPASMTPPASDADVMDHLEAFKLIFDLYSPTLDETNHLWGILGGKQYPSVMYTMRVLELKYRAVQRETGLITEIDRSFSVKTI